MTPASIAPERLIERPALTPATGGPEKEGEMVMGSFSERHTLWSPLL